MPAGTEGSETMDAMDTAESIECRIYMGENEMYLAARNLSADLHRLERAVTELRDRLHASVCEEGRQPVAEKARDAVADVQATIGQLDLEGISRRTRELEDMLSELDRLEADRRTACRPRSVTPAAA
jgi:hypothetical protein